MTELNARLNVSIPEPNELVYYYSIDLSFQILISSSFILIPQTNDKTNIFQALVDYSIRNHTFSKTLPFAVKVLIIYVV